LKVIFDNQHRKNVWEAEDGIDDWWWWWWWYH